MKSAENTFWRTQKKRGKNSPMCSKVRRTSKLFVTVCHQMPPPPSDPFFTQSRHHLLRLLPLLRSLQHQRYVLHRPQSGEVHRLGRRRRLPVVETECGVAERGCYFLLFSAILGSSATPEWCNNKSEVDRAKCLWYTSTEEE